jgi:hypothetical protein
MTERQIINLPSTEQNSRCVEYETGGLDVLLCNGGGPPQELDTKDIVGGERVYRVVVEDAGRGLVIGGVQVENVEKV